MPLPMGEVAPPQAVTERVHAGKDRKHSVIALSVTALP